MITLREYIEEGLLDTITNWLKSLFNDQEDIEKSPIEVDVENSVKSLDKPLKVSEIAKNKDMMKLISNQKAGLNTIALMIKNKEKYLAVEENGVKKEIDPLVKTYYSIDSSEGKDKRKRYLIGAIAYSTDEKNKKKVVIYCFDVVRNIKNKSRVVKTIINDFEEKMADDNKEIICYSGDDFPGSKNMLKVNGYREMKKDKDTIYKEI